MTNCVLAVGVIIPERVGGISNHLSDAERSSERHTLLRSEERVVRMTYLMRSSLEDVSECGSGPSNIGETPFLFQLSCRHVGCVKLGHVLAILPLKPPQRKSRRKVLEGPPLIVNTKSIPFVLFQLEIFRLSNLTINHKCN